jgi:FG-GAP repeat
VISVAHPYDYTGLEFRGEESGNLAGYSVSGVGDFNGDGFDDLIVTAPGTGTSYVIFGSQSPANVNLNQMSAAARFRLDR